MEKSENSSWMNCGLLLPGYMFVGTGVGMLYNVTQIGLFIGMGIGFISTGLIRLFKGQMSNRNQ